MTAYNGQDAATRTYDAKLDVPQTLGVRQGVVGGAAIGSMQCVMFISYGGEVACFFVVLLLWLWLERARA